MRSEALFPEIEETNRDTTVGPTELESFDIETLFGDLPDSDPRERMDIIELLIEYENAVIQREQATAEREQMAASRESAATKRIFVERVGKQHLPFAGFILFVFPTLVVGYIQIAGFSGMQYWIGVVILFIGLICSVFLFLFGYRYLSATSSEVTK